MEQVKPAPLGAVGRYRGPSADLLTKMHPMMNDIRLVCSDCERRTEGFLSLVESPEFLEKPAFLYQQCIAGDIRLSRALPDLKCFLGIPSGLLLKT